MSIWTVQTVDTHEQVIEAEMLATESGALVAFSEAGLMVRAWAPGQWLSMRLHSGIEAHPAGKGNARDNVLVGLPRG
jgi:hypothetical protein